MARDPPFLRSVVLMRDRIEDPNAYPFSLPAVQRLDGLELSAVTYFVGENGSGKSTILEALAVASGFNAEGGTQNFNLSTRSSESSLSPRSGWLALRAVLARGSSYAPRASSIWRPRSNVSMRSRASRLHSSIPTVAAPSTSSRTASRSSRS